MRHLMRTAALVGMVLGAASLAAATTAKAQVGQIGGSPHDLSTTGPLGALGSPSDEVCVFCHTPHAAQPQSAIAAPLWNKAIPAGPFTTYDSTTIDGTILPVGSVSIACLSCHDGSQAMDVVINAPGSRGVNSPAGAELSATLIGPIGGIAGTAANLGTDLSNDHPIGIQYGGFAPGGVQIDPDFAGGASLQTANINGTDVWWLDTPVGTAGTRDKNDVILYTRDNGGPQPFVECGSCHDPHQSATGQSTAPGSAVNFMRIANTASDLCTTCHVK